MSKTAKYTLILMFTTVLAKLLGFVREVALAYVYGAGATSDAYIVAFSIPTILFTGLGTALLTCYIPLYTELAEHRPEQAKPFNNNVTTLIFLLSLVILTVFWVFEEPIVRLFAMGFAGETFALAVTLSRVMIVSIVFMGVSNILQGYLQIKGSFFVIGIVSLPMNIFVIASILLANKEGTLLLAAGPVVGYAAALVMLAVAAWRRGFRYRPHLELQDREIKKMLLLVLPIFLGRTVMQINNMIDRTLASTLPEGSVSALNYASKVYGFVISVFVLSLATAVFPRLARQVSRSNTTSFIATSMTSVRMVTLLVLPISAGSIVLARPVVQLLFGRGAFSEEAITMTSQALVFYSLGLIFFSLQSILANTFYSMQDTKTPTINSIIAVGINIVLNFLLIVSLGHRGLALATSISGAVSTIMLGIRLRHKVGPLGLQSFAVSAVKMSIATGVMSAVAWGLMLLLQGRVEGTTGLLLTLGVPALAGAVVYFGLLIAMRTREAGELIVGAFEMIQRKKRQA